MYTLNRFPSIVLTCILLVSTAFLTVSFDPWQVPGIAERVSSHIAFLSSNASGQPLIIPSPAIAGDSVVIPLRRAGRLFLVEATVDGETGFLVFDTGASGIVLNRTYFRNHVVIGTQTYGDVNGSGRENEKIAIDRMEIGGIQYKGLSAACANLGHIENRRGVKVLGLFGFALFTEYEIVLDPLHNELKLYRLNTKGNRLAPAYGKFGADHTRNFEWLHGILFLKATVGGRELRFCLDTGAETNVLDSHAPKDALRSVSLTRRSNLKGVGQGSAEVVLGNMNDFSYDGEQINGMETIVTNLDPLGEAYGSKIDGMLGYSFISRGVICINFIKKELGISFIKQEAQ